MAVASWRAPLPTPRWSVAAGVTLLVASRAADVAITVPILAAAPEGEMNPIARALTPEWYVLANLVAVGLIVAVVEGLIIVDRRRNGPRTARREAATRLIAYGWVTLLSMLVVVHNARQLAGVLAYA